jgi:curved DNA-binding protein CbpA
MFESVMEHIKAVMLKNKEAYIEGRYDLDPQMREALDELGLPYGSDFKQIKARYFELSRQFHPDKQPEFDSARFLRIKEAYDVLKSAYKKKEEDG